VGRRKDKRAPKEKDPAFANAYFALLLGMDDLFHPAHYFSEAKSFFTAAIIRRTDWPVEKAAESSARAAQPRCRQRIPAIAWRDCRWRGELAVTGDGIGGRNSAFVLGAWRILSGRRVAVLSAGTDGIDATVQPQGHSQTAKRWGRAMAAAWIGRRVSAQRCVYFFSRG